MPKTNGCLGLPSLQTEKIELDALTLKKLALAVQQALYNLQSSRTSDILLTSLDNYLGESLNHEEASKSLILLNAYLDAVPKSLQEAEGLLAEANDQLAFLLASNNLGTANTSGSRDDG